MQRARNAYVRDRSSHAPALNSRRIRRASAAILFVISATGGSALAAPSAAVFPFEIFDTSGEQSSAGRDARLEMATRGLVESLTKSELFSPVDLTPLAAEMPYTLERNGQLPLWYHLGVGMFNRQADSLETRIRDHYYDLVLFEYLPTLNNFYPFRVRDSLMLHYQLVDSMMAPRRGLETRGTIEVYVNSQHIN